MKKNLTTLSRVTHPQSFITKGKHRLKQHNEIVYLNDNDEFEIELYNPTVNKILAKISLNGNSIGSGIVLKPGERVFLERYFNEPKKFKFETYFVGDTIEDENAIQNNGNISIEFYNEVALYQSITYTNYTYPISSNITWGSTDSFSYTTSNTIVNTSNTNTETGRIEMGDNSTQSFKYDNTSFSYSSFHSNFWKILPKSVKPLTREDLKTYCTECGAKRKKDSYKFCPHCGNKF